LPNPLQRIGALATKCPSNFAADADWRTAGTFGRNDYLWSNIVIKQVRIAELKAKLSEFLRAVQGGESFAVLDRNTAIAQIVPLRDRSGIRIRKPASGSPSPNKVPLPKPSQHKIDVLEMLLEERQGQR
jgi:antitoxin (DNA-binding transcriptional repressor) of toxin-antitoxin stability system